MAYLEIRFKTVSVEATELLMAKLGDLPFTGFQEEENCLVGFMQDGEFDEQLLKNIIDISFTKYSISVIEEKNWNEIWESDFSPVKIYSQNDTFPFAMVRANFHQPDPEVMYDLLITPKMSFGTGHHATTFQMMKQMAELDWNGKKVIDFGTGTGLLAILAEKMGADNILAIDNDDWSIENAKENFEANGCKKIELVKADICVSSGVKADILLANINLNVILDNLSYIVNAVSQGAYVLFSGILVQDLSAMKVALESVGLVITHTGERNGWLIIVAVK